MNWSATHEVRPRRLYQPETQAELEALVASHHKSGEAEDWRHTHANACVHGCQLWLSGCRVGWGDCPRAMQATGDVA